MRKLILTLFLTLTTVLAYSQVDSVKLEKLLSTTDNYLEAISGESVEFKSDEADFMIESCTDSVLKQTIALRIYDHYDKSLLMGDEGVKVHLIDKWFSTHEIEMRNEIELLNARIYADFNRATLIGRTAPQIDLEDIDNSPASIPQGGSFSIIYLYDTDCSKCKIEGILLRHFLEETETDLDFYAVYVGHDRDSWEEFVYNQFDINSTHVTMHHLWDPEGETDLLHSYGVLQTPVMLLLDKECKVLGRNLDTESLKTLLGYVRIYSDLYSRAEVGSRVPSLKLPGKKVVGGKEKEGTWRIDKPGYLIFHTEGCTRCQAELKALQSKMKKKTKVTMVNMDRLMDSDPELAKKVLDSFDLTVLPYITKLGKKGEVLEKYVSFIE